MVRQSIRTRRRIERRAAERHVIHADRSYTLVATIGNDALPARVANISTSGISLILQQPVAADTLLNVVLANTAQLFSRVLPTRVIHVRQSAAGFYVAGCQFQSPLSYDDLRSLLA